MSQKQPVPDAHEMTVVPSTSYPKQLRPLQQEASAVHVWAMPAQ